MSTTAAPEVGPQIVGLFGGSGLYELEGLEDVRAVSLTTPYGAPSDPPLVGRLGPHTVVFIPRHGKGHRLSPSEINYRANVHAMKQLGVTRVLSVSAVGSLREEIVPGDFVLVDQFIDRTHLRASTFFGGGCVGHVAFATPVCGAFADHVAQAAEAEGFAAGADTTLPGGGRRLVRGGTYVCMEGPQFSTRAESLFHRGLGAAVIGMTGVTEAKLCREAELCFTLLALATDYDCWHPEEESVTAGAVIEVLRANIERAKAVVRRTILTLGDPAQDRTTARDCGCGSAAAHAIITAREAISPEARERLRVLYGRYIG
jgi:5'-methylthioadenosine phosphorylase